MKQTNFFKSRWGSPEEIERHRRIMVSIAAYAYEILNRPIWSDRKYDKECLKVNLKKTTGNKRMDMWFILNFKLHTGMWIHNHPQPERLKKLALKILKWSKL